MKINTKVVFEWNPESKQYEEIYCDSYDYDGEVAECQNYGQGGAFNPQLDYGAAFQGDIGAQRGYLSQLGQYQQGQPSQRSMFMRRQAERGRPSINMFTGGLMRNWGEMQQYQPNQGFQQGPSALLGSAANPYTQGTYNPNDPYQSSSEGWGGMPAIGPQSPAGSTPGEGFGKPPTKSEFDKYQASMSKENVFWEAGREMGVSGIGEWLGFAKQAEGEGGLLTGISDWWKGRGKKQTGPTDEGKAPWEFASVNRGIGQMKPFGAKGIVPGQRKTSALGTGTLGQTKPSYSDLLQHPSEKEYSKGLLGTTAAKEEASSIFGSLGSQEGMTAGGALLGGITGYMQAKSQRKGLASAISELDPIKTQAYGAYERSLGLAEAYRPGGKYSRYMGGQMVSQAEEAVGQETSRMIASGITSPSMMRQMGIQSRRSTQAAMPGMEMQISQMALPYEQLAGGYFGEYRGLGEQMAGLRGARDAINPWSSAISGAVSGAAGAATMIGSLASDRRMKKDIKYLHTSNEGHRVYSFKYKDGDTRYSGVMAQDVLKINPNAVTLKNGMLAVYYDMIDVDMQQLDIIQ